VNFPAELERIVGAFPHPLVFATLSGAHLYGFPSPDSDFDLRGCHVLPIADVVGLRDPDETEERLGPDSGLDLDLVSHDVRKFCRLLLRPNGYVLEQLLSPLVLHTTPEHDELRALAPRLVTRHHAYHYLGFARNQWGMFERDPRVKSLLYVYRVLLTGIHLMRSGEVQGSLPLMLADYPQPGVGELIAAKTSGVEKQPLPDIDVAQHAAACARLMQQLEQERDRSHLADRTDAFEAVNALVVRIRLARLLPGV
jgi:hypothetical protein